MTNIISTTILEIKNASVFKIPPGENSLSKWDLQHTNVIWTGDLRFKEEEVVKDEEIEILSNSSCTARDQPTSSGDGNLNGCENGVSHMVKPCQGLRLKLELVNSLSDEFMDEDSEKVWAECWYNPVLPSMQQQESWSRMFIANNRQETIQMSIESPKYYKIIVQLPGSGYHPFSEEAREDKARDKKDDGTLVQVALGLKFQESFDSISFAESLGAYKRRFRIFEEQHGYDQNLLDLERKQSELSLDANFNTSASKGVHRQEMNSNQTIVTERDLNESDDNDENMTSDKEENDDFGDFVSS